jgi:hypothetical protein
MAVPAPQPRTERKPARDSPGPMTPPVDTEWTGLEPGPRELDSATIGRVPVQWGDWTGTRWSPVAVFDRMQFQVRVG